jgi:hypothetical protein
MTAAQLKNYFRQQLVAQRQIAQEFNVLDALVDFISQAVTNGIPAWTAALTFNLDGSGDGSYTTHPDSNGALRFWKTKTDDNINNEPPTNPAVSENDNWIEVSPSDGSGIKEWAPGIFGEGLIIVYADLGSPDPDPGFYKLQVAERPFESTNLITELGDDKWIRIGGPGGDPGGGGGYEPKTFAAELTFEKNFVMVLDPQPGAIAFTLDDTDAEAGNVNKVYIKANGVNTPTYSADFIPQSVSWLNTINRWNVLYFEFSASGKVNYWVTYE